METQKFRRLCGWGFPWRKQEGERQRRHHAVQKLEIELLRVRRGTLRGGRGNVGRIGMQTLTALRAVSTDFR